MGMGRAFILALVFLSGITGLIYQITWQKYLSIYLGSHALSTTLTLSSFFLFLSFGYSTVGRFGHLISKNRIKAYAFIEGAIGIYSILSPSLFLLLYEAWPSYPSESLPHFISSYAFALLLTGFPTFLMGATIPLLTQGLSRNLEEGHQIHAWVYGLNTLGAFTGCLVAGFYFLEAFGLAQTLNIVGVVNCLLCLITMCYLKFSSEKFNGFEPTEKKPSSFLKGLKNPLVLTAFLSGMSAFALESLVIRIAGNSLGSSTYTYSLIVAAFIVSIALGTLVSSWATDKKGAQWLWFSQVLLCLSLAALYFVLPRWPDIFYRLNIMISPSEINMPFLWIFTFFTLTTTLILPVGLMGMTLPLIFQQLKNKGSRLNETAGAMYSVNAIGAALGAVLGGYILFQWLDFSQVFTFVIATAFLSTLLIAGSSIGKVSLRRINAGSFIALIALLSVALSSGWSERSFVPSRFSVGARPKTQKDLSKIMKWFNDANDYPKIIWSDFGPNTYTTVVEDKEGDRSLLVNSKPDAETSGDRMTRALTALFPAFLTPSIENTFIVGLGTGMSTGLVASLPDAQSVKVVEIARGAVKALPFFEKWNFYFKENQNKISIFNDDAYKVLKNEDLMYDMILSEPSSIWVTGVEKIYTEEFLKKVSQRLKKHGSYSQWFPIFGLDDQSFLAILTNFQSAFEHVTVWDAGYGRAMMIIGRHSPIEISKEHIEKKQQQLKPFLTELKLGKAQDLLGRQVFSSSDVKRLTSYSKVQHSLYHPTLAFRAGRAHFLNQHINLEELVHKLFTPYDSTPGIESLPQQDLVWQKSMDLLSKDFFLDAQKRLSKFKNLKFIAGRLSLAMYRKFPQTIEKIVFQQQKAKKKSVDGFREKSMKEKVADKKLDILQMDYLTNKKVTSMNLLSQQQKKHISTSSHRSKGLRFVDRIDPNGTVNTTKSAHSDQANSKSEDLFNSISPKYRVLRKMRMPASIKRVTRLAPHKCQSDECIKNKLDLLDIHFKEELSDLSFEPEKSAKNVNHAKIETFFEEKFKRL